MSLCIQLQWLGLGFVTVAWLMMCIPQTPAPLVAFCLPAQLLEGTVGARQSAAAAHRLLRLLLLPAAAATCCCCRVSDSSGEGFAARLFKGGHPEGWVRAFSDSPSAMTAEFNKVCAAREWGWGEEGEEGRCGCACAGLGRVGGSQQNK
jgi:hypothetical protein